MTITDIHGRISNIAMLFFLILSLWGFFRFFRKQGLDPSYWGALAIGEGIILVQAVLGAYLWIVGTRPARGIHVLYGLVALAIIPTVYTYTKGQDSRADGHPAVESQRPERLRFARFEKLFRFEPIPAGLYQNAAH